MRGHCFAPIHYTGRSYKKCLETHDRKTAERRLSDFEKQIERQSLQTPDLLHQDLSAK
jgi:hypothetical protein